MAANEIRRGDTKPRRNIIRGDEILPRHVLSPMQLGQSALTQREGWRRPRKKRAERMPLGNKRRHASERGTERKGRYTRAVHTTFGLSIRDGTLVGT